MPLFVRFQSAVRNRHGSYPGVFAMANGLGRARVLTREDHEAWCQANALMDAAYRHPTDTDPSCYDAVLYPGAVAWFKGDEAQHLIGLTGFYLDLLDRYRAPWVEVRTTSPGRIHFEDDVQVVTTPWTYPQDWPVPRPARC